jgi:hypothetical protein
MASAAWAVAGVSSTGWLAMLVATKLRAKTRAEKIPTKFPKQPKSKEKAS